MCGVNAIYKIKTETVDVTDLKRMSSAIAHRGPDESGFAILNGGKVGFAHVRLSIIDIEQGQQPMYNEDQTIAITYNGEIYDHMKLREDLIEKGHRFHTHSDTEVVIHLYEEYGLDFFEHLNGEFAFVLWDGQKKRLIAASDRCNIKPLFYHVADKEILFSSEVKGLFALNRIEKQFCKDYLMSMPFGFCTQGGSTFRNIQSVKAGHYLIVDEKGVQEKEYWSQKYNIDESISFEEAKEKVSSLFHQAVQRRMVADVPVGTYLSGGIDSTLVCAMMAKHEQNFKAYNIGFVKTAYNEASLAEKIAKHYGADFESMDCSMEDIADGLEKTLYHTEVALGNPSAVGKQLLSAHIRAQGRKVCITGEGADEIFAGYPFFKQEKLWRMMKQGGEEAAEAKTLWEQFQKTESRSEGIMWAKGADWEKIQKIFGFPLFREHVMGKINDKVAPNLYNNKALGITESDRPLELFKKTFPPEVLSKMDPINATRQTSMNFLFGCIIPTLGDRVEMANSIECRTPFMDRDLLKYTCTIPPEYLMNIKKLREKHLLHESFKDELPPFMHQEHKHPFFSSDWRSFIKTKVGKGIYKQYMSQKALKESQIYDAGFVSVIKLMWRGLPQGAALRKNLDIIIGIILSMQIMHDQFIKNPIPSNPEFDMVDRSPNIA